MVVDELAKQLNVSIEKEKMLGLVGETVLHGEKILFVKPLTYMNLSGNCVAEVMQFYKLPSENLIVIYDDIDIEVGKIRIKPSGSPGTHNGMRDIVQNLGTQEFVRVRVGSGKPQQGEDLASYVLGNFYEDEIPQIQESVQKAAKATLEVLEQGVQSAMNHYNEKGR